MKYARAEQGLVVEVFDLPKGLAIENAFHPDVAAKFAKCPSGVETGWIFDGGSFAPPPPEAIDLDRLKAEQIASLSSACFAAILGGYASKALGASHVYPSKQTDQINMMASVTDSLLPGLSADWSTPFWCRDENGEWEFRKHSAAQIQEAGKDCKAHIIANQRKLEKLIEDVGNCETETEISNVVWG